MEDKEFSENQRDISEEKRQNSLDNLRPWKPGESGNPAGRPKDDLCITPSLRAILNEVPGEEDGIENPKGLTYLELWIRRWGKRSCQKMRLRILRRNWGRRESVNLIL